jgi:hypothetical protein
MEPNKTIPKPSPTGCCPPFDPTSFKQGEVLWTDKLFVSDHVVAFLHIPLNLGRRVVRNQRLIDLAGATPVQPLMLCHDKSPWGTDIYIEVTKPVSGAKMARLSGTYVTRLYEGPYSQAGKWAEDMHRHVAAQGRDIERIYFAYTTCPSCARAYGKNYVVLFAQVASARAATSTPRAIVTGATVGG